MADCSIEKNKRDALINEMVIQNDEPWQEKMLKTLHFIYGKAPFYEKHIELFRDILSQEWEKLVDLNIAVIKTLYRCLGLRDNLLMSSILGIDLMKDDKLVAICEELGAGIYLANNGSKDYIDPGKFHGRGIGFVFQDYGHPEYPVQKYQFKPYLSAIDLLFWHGPDTL